MTSPNGPVRVAIVFRLAKPDWKWVIPDLPADAPELDVHYFNIGVAGRGLLNLTPLKIRQKAKAVWTAHRKKPFDLILSFAPSVAGWVETARGGADGHHRLFGFNFTDMPTGFRRSAMEKGLKRVERYYTFTAAEIHLYADYFNLDPAQFEVVPWGVTPPAHKAMNLPDAPYVVALGGEARDYATLIEAARDLPELNFVVIARPQNVADLDVPPNVTVKVNLPPEEAWALVNGSALHVLPLRARETPCGIVTAVGAMHLGKPQVLTQAVGIEEYAPDGECGLLVPPKDPAALKSAIEQLINDDDLRARFGESAANRAHQRYSEGATIDFAKRLFAEIAESKR